MIESDFKFLKFRTELIELLNKYHYDIAGTGYDDGSMRIDAIQECTNYILRDDTSDYEASRVDDEFLVDISADYILNIFPEQQRSIMPNKTKIGIFTNSRYKAILFFDELYNRNNEQIEWYKNSKDEISLLLKDESYYTWIKPIDSSRGHRCSKAYIDKNLTLNELQEIVFPICVFCTRDTVKVI